MKKGAKKETTIDDLAVMVAKGFGRVDEKFEKIDKKFEKRFNELDESIKAVRQDVLDIGDRFVPRYEFDDLLLRFNKLERKVKEKIK